MVAAMRKLRAFVTIKHHFYFNVLIHVVMLK